MDDVGSRAVVDDDERDESLRARLCRRIEMEEKRKKKKKRSPNRK